MFKFSQWKPVWLNIRLYEFLLAMLGCMVCSQAGADSLRDAIHQTLVNHPEILSSQAEEKAAAHDIREAQGGYLPSLDLFAGFGKENTDNPATRGTGRGSRTFTRQESEFQLEQLLWDGGFVKNRIGERRHLHERTGYQVSEDQERLAFEAARAYLSIKRDNELVEVSKLDVRAHDETLVKVKRRLQAGAGRRSEINLVDSRLQLAHSRLVLARSNLQDAQVNYEKVVGVKPASHLPMPVVPTNMPPSLTQAQDMGLQTSPAIAAFQAEFDATTNAIGVAKSTFYPRLTFDVEGSWSDNLDGIKGYNNDLLAVVRMHYNVLRGGSDKAAMNAAIDRRASANFALENAKRTLREDIGLAWIDWQNAKGRVKHLRIHRDESLEVYKAYQKQFQLGQRTLFDLLNAQVEYYGARRDLIADVYEEKISRYRILSTMGRLVHTVSHHNARHNLRQVDKPPVLVSKKSDVATAPKLASKEAFKGSPTKMAVAQQAIAVKINPVNSKVVDATRLAAAKHYTLQLMASKDRHAVDDFVVAHHLQGNATIHTVHVNGSRWFRLSYGDYPNIAAARAAKGALPRDLAGLTPMVRNVALVSADTSNHA